MRAILQILLLTFATQSAAENLYAILRPEIVKELLNRSVNNSMSLGDGVVDTFTERGNAVTNYYNMRVTYVDLLDCDIYDNGIWSCLISYRVESDATDPLTKLMVMLANVKPVRREFQYTGRRWYLLEQQ